VFATEQKAIEEARKRAEWMIDNSDPTDLNKRCI
jgi:hypothetical protein